jgi:predicted RND superfamily exporter protein
MQYITSDSESIIVTDLVDDDFSGTPEEIAELKRRIDSWDMYRGVLVSEDFTATQVVVNLDVASERSGEPEVMAVLTRIRETAKEMFAGSAAVYTAGQAVVSATLSESALGDIVFLIPLVIAVLLTVLIFSFRRISYVTLPLLPVVIATIWGVGAMPLFGVKLTMVSLILPVILIAVGSAYSIHVISHYKDGITEKTFTAQEHRLFVLALTRKLLKPVFLASLTTFAGFVSFCFSPNTALQSFGVFASFGVLAAFAVALTLIPAILLIRGPRAVMPAANKKIRNKTPRLNFENALATTMTAIAKKKALVLTTTVLVMAVSIAGAVKVIIDSSMIEFFNTQSEVSRSDRFIREHFGGSSQIIVSVEADNTETLLSPDVLAAVEGLSEYLIGRVPNVGKVTGFTDMVKRMNQMFNVDEPPDGIRAKSGTSDTAGDGFAILVLGISALRITAGRCVYDKCQAGFFKSPSFFLFQETCGTVSSSFHGYARPCRNGTPPS